MTKINKKNIEKLALQEIRCFRDNRRERIVSDYWLCNQIGYIDALLYILDRHSLRELFDEVHNKIREQQAPKFFSHPVTGDMFEAPSDKRIESKI